MPKKARAPPKSTFNVFQNRLLRASENPRRVLGTAPFLLGTRRVDEFSNFRDFSSSRVGHI